jgi:hypothetical protein
MASSLFREFFAAGGVTRIHDGGLLDAFLVRPEQAGSSASVETPGHRAVATGGLRRLSV